MQMKKSTHLWREEDHPRDELGRFCKSNKLYEETVDKIQKDNIEYKKEQLTKKELAIWYQKISDKKLGAYFYEISSNIFLIPVAKKVVFTGGTYENPKALKVIQFSSYNEVTYFLNFLEDFK